MDTANPEKKRRKMGKRIRLYRRRVPKPPDPKRHWEPNMIEGTDDTAKRSEEPVVSGTPSAGTVQSKGGAKRYKSQRENDQAFIAERLVQGWPTAEIMVALNDRNTREGRGYTLGRSAILADIKEIFKAWREHAIGDVETFRARELMGMEYQEQQAWNAWHESRKPKVRRESSEENGIGENQGGKVKRSTTEEGQSGDPSYLRVISEIRAQRAKILGLNAPERKEFSGPDGNPIAIQQDGGMRVIVLPSNGFEGGAATATREQRLEALTFEEPKPAMITEGA